MRARSFQAWAARTSDIEVFIHQTLEETHGLYRFGVHLYNHIQRNVPWLHHVYFNYLELAGMFRSEKKILGADRFIRLLQDIRPDVILSVHGSTNHGFFDLARRALGREHVRCVTYCGELFGGYGFSKHWVNPDADLFIGAVSETREEAIRLGTAPNKTIVGGFLLNPRFFDPPMTATMKRDFFRDSLGLDPEQFTLLLSTGAAGANNHESFLNALDRSGLSLQVVVLCGHNKRVYERLSRWEERQNGPLRVKRMTHTDQMPALLQSVSAVVARAGTGTTSESILNRCPIIINGLGGIMPQEWITTKFCRQHSIAETVLAPSQLPSIVARWIDKPDLLIEMKSKLALAQPEGHPERLLDHIRKIV